MDQKHVNCKIFNYVIKNSNTILYASKIGEIIEEDLDLVRNGLREFAIMGILEPKASKEKNEVVISFRLSREIQII